jgi:nitroreductase
MSAIPANRHPVYPVDQMFPARWSPRAFSDAPISEAQMLSLLEAARWAPSASNIQPWRLVWGLRGDAGFATIFDSLSVGNQVWAGKAAALVAVGSKSTRTTSSGEEVPNLTHAFDTGAAWASLAFQAHLSGFVTHGMGGFDKDKLSGALNVPQGHGLHAVIAIGHPGDPASLPEDLRNREVPSQRKSLSDIAARGAFPG